MLEELLNSKMFLLSVAIITGFILGAIIRRISRSEKSYMSIGIPFIGLFMTALIIYYVKLNVTYFDIKYTLMGIAGLIVLGFLLGYLMYLYSDKKISFFYNFCFIYTGLCVVIFYVFFKQELKINTTECPETKDIYLLLKKEDAGYFEINEEGIGYVGSTLFNDGFRPKFLAKGVDKGIYSPVPIAVILPTKSGDVHALRFKLKENENLLNLNDLIDRGIVKTNELKLGDLNKKTN